LPKQTFINLEAEKQERIMRSAINEFQANGFDNAKVGTIAKQAAIAKGSIYQYFDDKEEFFKDTVSWAMEYLQLFRNQQTLLNFLDVFEYLLSSGKQRIELIRMEPQLSKFLQEVYAGKYLAVMESPVREMWWVRDADIGKMIQTGKDKGSIRHDIDDDILLVFFKGVLEKIDQMILAAMDSSGQIEDGQVENLDLKIRGFMKLVRTGMGS
jgi:AcrR family transcriptional regulator